MKLFSREFGHSYETYSFGYCNFAVREEADVLARMYEKGYLPYSGKLDIRDTFYMARSARVPLKRFSLNSENRRIAKKHDGVFEKSRVPIADFDVTDENFLSFCLEYFKARHGDVMPRERLEFLLSLNLISHIVIYQKEGVILGYIFEVSDEEMTHFWYSFYDLSYLQQSLGLWLMLDNLKDAHAADREHFYLGTAYGAKGLYKTNFEPLEFWDGSTWNSDTKQLKELCRRDG